VKGLSRLDAVKQALVLFVHSKLLMHSQHRFAVATLRNNAVWYRQEFTNDMEVIGQAVRGLASGGTFPRCDLSELFQMAATEAHSSHAMDRTLRVVLSLSSVLLVFTQTLWHVTLLLVAIHQSWNFRVSRLIKAVNSTGENGGDLHSHSK
jgi:hypothetical protein